MITSTAVAPLSTLLRVHTRAAHTAAEDSPFMGQLLSGTYAVDAYLDLLVQLRGVYRALETTNPALVGHPASAVLDSRLHRSAAIDADIESLRTGPLPTVTREAAAYAARIKELATSWPAGFVAHHYTRYLGDIAGGQAIRVALVQTFKLDAGTSFFDFNALGGFKPFRDRYRATLDVLPLADSERLAVADEAIGAFEHNQAIFHALAARHVAVA
jgi:heme oxygenase